MTKYKRRHLTDQQKLKNYQRSFSHFLLVEAKAIGVEAEAVDEIAAFTSPALTQGWRTFLNEWVTHENLAWKNTEYGS